MRSFSASRTPGSWGAGLCKHLQHAGHAVVEVERPRKAERRVGKSDRIDAPAAASTCSPATSLTHRRWHPQAARAPPPLDALAGQQRHRRTRRLRRHARPRGPLTRARRRRQALQSDLAELVCSLDDTILDEPGIGPISAVKLLACDPNRLKHEAAFARCNGTAPLPASSGKTVRHRLNRGGDRQLNNAIHTIAVIRSKHHPETRAYLDRHTSEGKREALRALKRHLSRDHFKRRANAPLTS